VEEVAASAEAPAAVDAVDDDVVPQGEVVVPLNFDH
jgi:hypothetical protein